MERKKRRNIWADDRMVLTENPVERKNPVGWITPQGSFKFYNNDMSECIDKDYKEYED
jgi:hypothetical protein